MLARLLLFRRRDDVSRRRWPFAVNDLFRRALPGIYADITGFLYR